MKKYVLIVALAMLAACSDKPTYPQQQPIAEQPVQVVQQPAQVYQQPAPVIVQQSNPNDGFLTGMLMGHMMSGGGGGYSRNTTVVNKTIVNKTVVNRPAPTYRPSPSVSRPSPSFSRRGR